MKRQQGQQGQQGQGNDETKETSDSPAAGGQGGKRLRGPQADRGERNERTRAQLRAVGERLRYLRRARGFRSQESFVLRAGFARAYYAGVESGERNVALTNLIRIAAALRVELGALFPPLSVLTEGEVSAEPLPETSRGALVPRLGGEQTLPQPDIEAHRAGLSSDTGESSATVDTPGQFQWEPFPALPASQDAEDTEPLGVTEAERAGLRGRLISTGTAAEILGVDQRTVQRWLQDKALPVADFVDNRFAVFIRDDIYRVAEALKSQAAREEAELRRGSQDGEHDPPQ